MPKGKLEFDLATERKAFETAVHAQDWREVAELAIDNIRGTKSNAPDNMIDTLLDDILDAITDELHRRGI